MRAGALVEPQYDVYGVGNAIVDIEVQVTDALLASWGLKKGTSALVTLQEQERTLASLGGHSQTSAAGGSAANTMVGIALFGGRVCFSGKVGNDPQGALYRRSLAQVGVESSLGSADGPTGSCLVLVTPDGERTMQTSLGSSAALGPADIDVECLARSRLLYVEGYLWGAPATTSATHHAMESARSAGVSVACSFSDPTLVQHLGDGLRHVTSELVDIVFCNEWEARAYAATDDRQQALLGVGRDCPRVFMTCGADGSIVYEEGHVSPVSGYQVPVVDTTGAGDAYAAGVLYGLAHGMTAERAARLGSFASAWVVAHLGPRLTVGMADRIPAILGGVHPLDSDHP